MTISISVCGNAAINLSQWGFSENFLHDRLKKIKGRRDVLVLVLLPDFRGEQLWQFSKLFLIQATIRHLSAHWKYCSI